MLASSGTFRKVLEFSLGGSLHQHPFFLPPEEFSCELRGRRVT